MRAINIHSLQVTVDFIKEHPRKAIVSLEYGENLGKIGEVLKKNENFKKENLRNRRESIECNCDFFKSGTPKAGDKQSAISR